MHINDGYEAGILLLYPSGTNSTFFTQCCGTAICDDQACCPSCGRKVIGWDAESGHARGRVRWNHAYQRKRKYGT